MQTLTIPIPQGYEIDSLDKATGVVKLKEKPKKLTERIKTVDDLLAANSLTRDQFNQSCIGLSDDEVAYRIIKMLARTLNEGWIPDWSNSSEYKYYPWFEMRGSSGFRFDDCDNWASHSYVGSRLCFKTRELAEHAAKHFTPEYERLMVIK